MKPTTCFLTLILSLVLIACNNVIDKGKEIADATEKKVSEKSEELVNKVIPHFDADEADTKYNKERFRDFLQVDLTDDIRDIYCYGDAMGIDAKYQFSFRCDKTTVQRIIEKHGFKPDTGENGFAFDLQREFTWWDKQKIKALKAYSWKDEQQFFKYFWYDATEQKAYYFDFDL